MNSLFVLYRWLFCRVKLYGFHQKLFNIALRGMGILNYESYKISGEKWLQEYLLSVYRIKTVVDIGANSDPYGMFLPETTKIFAFEPNPIAFKKLQLNLKSRPNFETFKLGMSDRVGKLILWDQKDNSGSAMSSIYKQPLEITYKLKTKKRVVSVTTIDRFMKQKKLDSIDFLKIDTEGHEYKVLLGARKTLQQNKIGIILFEFNDMNVYSRVFMRDFFELLKNFSMYRLLQDGLVPLGNYNPLTHELFAFQNIVAIRNDIKAEL